MRRLILAAALIVAASPALAAPVALKAELLDDNGQVTLGEIFDGAGRASGVVVATRPSPTVVLDAGRVQALARANGLDWSNETGLRRLVVKAGITDMAAGSSAAGARGAQAEVLTYARSLAAGEVVQPSDVVWAKVQAHLAPADAPQDAEIVIGQAAKRPLRSGAAVALRDLAAAQVIKKDQIVSVSWRMGGVNLVLQGKALQNAAVGEAFSVLNPQSKKTIEAVAAGPGRAIAGPEAEGLRAQRFAALR
jgi:flagella basal body P-ring formation protein FlgA